MLLDGAEVDEIEPGASTEQPYEGLYDALRRRRREHPTSHVVLADNGPYDLELPPDVAASLASSILLTAAYAGHPRARVASGERSVMLHMPQLRPGEDQRTPTDRDWLVVRWHPSKARLEWLHEDGATQAAGTVRAKDVVGPGLAEKIGKAYVELGEAAPCDDIVFEAAPDARFWPMLEVLEAIGSARPCAHTPWVNFAFRTPGPLAKPTYPGPAHARLHGRLEPKKIQALLRTRYEPFRVCYERALAKDPQLEGKVTVRFTIQRDGSVTDLAVVESQLPETATSCIVDAYRKLVFPKPFGGTVTVVYPILFSPG